MRKRKKEHDIEIHFARIQKPSINQREDYVPLLVGHYVPRFPLIRKRFFHILLMSCIFAILSPPIARDFWLLDTGYRLNATLVSYRRQNTDCTRHLSVIRDEIPTARETCQLSETGYRLHHCRELTQELFGHGKDVFKLPKGRIF